jgi:hypothetical protein
MELKMVHNILKTKKLNIFSLCKEAELFGIVDK